MSYNLTLQCGRVVYVSSHPESQIPHTRVIESRAQMCPVRRHDVGVRLYVWELLPEAVQRLCIDELTSEG